MEHLLTDKEYNRMTEAICSWCLKYVFKNNQEEFKYRLKEKIKCV